MLGFNFEIMYKPGLENKAADALSRRSRGVELQSISMGNPISTDDIQAEAMKDDRLRQII